MSNKSLIVLIVVLITGILFFYIRTARLAQAESDRLLTEFKKVDSSITVQNVNERYAAGGITIDSSSNEKIELSLKANKILATIDSVKNELQQLKDRERLVSFSSTNKERLRTLKIDLLDYNAFIHKNFSDSANIETSNFIDVSDVVRGATHLPWEIHFFEKTNFYQASTLLASVRYRVLNLEQKIIKRK